MMTTFVPDSLRDARRRSGLSQADLGRVAGLPQSAVSRYENGSKTPSVPVLTRLFEAAGFDVTLVLQPRRSPAGSFTGPVGQRVQPRRAELRSFLAAAGAGSPRVFGSVARGDDDARSDLDIAVDLPEGLGLFGLSALARQAGEIAGVPVDLVPRDGLSPEVVEAVQVEGIAL